MGSGKESKRNAEEDGDNKETKWEDKLARVGPIAKPMATRKLAKKIYKITKKAQSNKSLRKGVRDIPKYLRKGEKGLIVIAGDTTPVEIVCHMPLLCEESDIPYCYVPSKDDLGSACGSHHPTAMIMIKPHENYQELYDTVKEEMKALPLPI